MVSDRAAAVAAGSDFVRVCDVTTPERVLGVVEDEDDVVSCPRERLESTCVSKEGSLRNIRKWQFIRGSWVRCQRRAYGC